MWLNVANIETNIKFIDESLGVFRVHENSRAVIFTLIRIALMYFESSLR